MFVVHPFQLVPALLVPARRWRAARAAPAARPAAMAARSRWRPARPCCCSTARPTTTISRRSTRRCTRRTPRWWRRSARRAALYVLLDDFTERVDTDLSNNAGMLGRRRAADVLRPVSGRQPDRRLAEAAARLDAGYAPATLGRAAVHADPAPRVLLAGASGGFRVCRRRWRSAPRDVRALEPEPVLLRRAAAGLGPSPPLPPTPSVTLCPTSPLADAAAALRPDRHLRRLPGRGRGQRHRLQRRGASRPICARLQPGGIVSIPVSIREFPVYAVRVLATVRAGAARGRRRRPGRACRGVPLGLEPAHPGLASDAWTPTGSPRSAAFCDERSFDVSYYPGIDVAAARGGHLQRPAGGVFRKRRGGVRHGPEDAIADEAAAGAAGRASASERAFNLSPDHAGPALLLRRPAAGRSSRTILKRLEILPQAGGRRSW